MMSEATEKKPAKVVLKELQDKIADDAWEAKSAVKKSAGVQVTSHRRSQRRWASL